MQDAFRRFLVLTGVIVAGLMILRAMDRRNGGYGLWDFLRGRPVPVFAPEEYTLPAEPAIDADEVPLLTRLNQEYARLTAAVVPSVVSIDTRETVAVQSGFPGLYRQFQQPGLGSGVIVTPEGHIITNHHVVANKDAIRVTRTTSDGRREVFAADLVGSLASYDIAVLRIRSERRDFPALKFADSGKVQVGHLALAVGNPFGLAESVTQGIISAVDRRISDSGPSYFQTDTPINPGNSGGPLVNFQGEIIGINAIVLRGPEADRAAQNIGFAIPAKQAWEAFEIITSRGRPVFGYLGLSLGEVSPQIASVLRLPGTQGVWVQAVMPGSPAADAGLRSPEAVRAPGGEAAISGPDVILTLDDEPVNSGEEFISRIRQTTPGTSVRLGIWRDGVLKEILVTVGDSNSLPVPVASTIPGKESGTATPTLDHLAQGRAILGSVGVSAGVAPTGAGIRVDAVRPGSLADGKIKPGDRILAVNATPVSSPAEFNRAVLTAASSRAGLTMSVEHDGQKREILLAR